MTLLWSANHEAGNLDEWSMNGGGGLYPSPVDTPHAVHSASRDQARSGAWSHKMQITTPSEPAAGCRAFRWAEPIANRVAYYSCWFFVPTDYTLTHDPETGRFLNLWQFKSRSQGGARNDPLWALYATPDATGKLYLRVGWGWGGTTCAGPYSSSPVGGKWYEPSMKNPIPVGRWFQVQAYLYQSKGFGGQLKVWVDGVQTHTFQNVRTSYPNTAYNAWQCNNEWSVNLYSDGMEPNPAVIYIDDAAISLTYIST